MVHLPECWGFFVFFEHTESVVFLNAVWYFVWMLRYSTVWEDILRVCVSVGLPKCCEYIGWTHSLTMYLNQAWDHIVLVRAKKILHCQGYSGYSSRDLDFSISCCLYNFLQGFFFCHTQCCQCPWTEISQICKVCSIMVHEEEVRVKFGHKHVMVMSFRTLFLV